MILPHGTRPRIVLLVFPLLLATATPARTPAPPRQKPQAGWLVIVGGGRTPVGVLNRFLELAGGKKARLVIIPTAHTAADRLETMASYSYWKAQKVASVTFLHTRQTAKANDPNFVKPLSQATGVWMSGGDQSLLVAPYRGSLVEQELRKLLARGGVIGGTSAGASAMSRLMIVGGNPQAREVPSRGSTFYFTLSEGYAEKTRP
jgi:cyanophycinase